MSTPARALGDATPPSPSAEPLVRDRPRLLSYVGRWGRARRWLPDDARTVLDVGCAFGYGTAALAARAPGRTVIGIDRDLDHVREAARRYPWLTVRPGDAAALPASDGTVDAVTLLEVLEHLGDPGAAVAEARRVLRSGGTVIVSVPHRGVLAGLDSLNVYPALRRRRPNWPPLDPADDCDGGHRHFTVDELRALLEKHGFVVTRTARTGLGIAEPFRLAVLVVFKGLLRMNPVHDALMVLYPVLYVLDDLVPTGRFAFYLAVQARVVENGPAR